MKFSKSTYLYIIILISLLLILSYIAQIVNSKEGFSVDGKPEINKLLKEYVYFKIYIEILNDVKQYYSIYTQSLNDINSEYQAWFKQQMQAYNLISSDFKSFMENVFYPEYKNIINKNPFQTDDFATMGTSYDIIINKISDYIYSMSKNDPTSNIDWNIEQIVAPKLKDAYLSLITDIKNKLQICKDNIKNFGYNDDLCNVIVTYDVCSGNMNCDNNDEYIILQNKFYNAKNAFYSSVGCKINSLLTNPEIYPLSIEQCAKELENLMIFIGSGSSQGSGSGLYATTMQNITQYVPDSQYLIYNG